MRTLKIISPNGHLGFAPIRTGSFELGVAAWPDYVAADSGSDDVGPVPLDCELPQLGLIHPDNVRRRCRRSKGDRSPIIRAECDSGHQLVLPACFFVEE